MMSPLSTSTTHSNDAEDTSPPALHPVAGQAERAIASGQFELARTVLDEAVGASDDLAPQAGLLELLGQAQTGLQNHTEAAQAFQSAYEAATEPRDKSRLFHLACQAYQQTRDFSAMVQMANLQLEQTMSARERAKCLLVAGESSVRLRRYREARERYLIPAADIGEAEPTTRAYIWNYMGFCAFAEHRFAEAAEAFQKANGFGFALQYQIRSPEPSPLRAELHHLRNTAHFYTGVMHLIDGHPQAAISALQEVKSPLLAERQLYTALFLALAYLRTHQLDKAEQALQPLVRAADLPESVRAPYAVVCAGMANCNRSLEVVGAHLEAALDAAPESHTSWEPSWHALMHEALGIALIRAGYRKAGMACYEESLKAIVERIHPWVDMKQRHWLRGTGLLNALENILVEAWPPVTQSEMCNTLQALAWLYQSHGDVELADTAYNLALRVTRTSEQRASIWIQRGWMIAIAPQGEALSSCRREVIRQLEDQAGRLIDAHPELHGALRGIEALLKGENTQAFTRFESLMLCPEMPYVQTICLSGWIWAHARTGHLEKALTETPLTSVPAWGSEMTRLETLERLLMWTFQDGDHALERMATWLALLCATEEPSLMVNLRLLCQPGYLPDDLHPLLLAGLSKLKVEAPHEPWADAIAELLGYDALVSRIEPLLAVCDQSTVVKAPTAKGRKRRPNRRSGTQTERESHRTRLHHLVERLSIFSQPEDEDRLPNTITEWLLRYPHLSQNAPDVVGGLLGLLREHPGAHAQRQLVLDRVDLSRRQRQLLEEAQLTSDDVPASSAADWEPLRYATLDFLLANLREGKAHLATRQHTNATQDYTLAITLARVGLVNRTPEVLQACLQQAPEQPLAHFMLGQTVRLQHHTETAWKHTWRAWELLHMQSSEPTLLHLQIINQMLVLLGARQQGDTYSTWIETFKRMAMELKAASPNPELERRLRYEEGECALSHMLYLSTFPPVSQDEEALAEQQLDLLAEAIEKGNALTRHEAFHYRADLLSRLQRLGEAESAYRQIVEQWPDDRQARFRHALLTASRLAAESDGEGAEPVLAEALALAFAAGSRHDRPSPLTLRATLEWLRHVSRRDARYADVVDVLTAYGRIALQCEEAGMAIEILAPLYEIIGEPRQAYYLAQAHRAQCQQAESESAALADCERAMALARHALESDLHRAYAEVVLAQLEEDRERLLAAQLLDMPQPDHKLGETEDMTELQVIPSEASTLEMQASQGENGTSISVKHSGWMRDWWSRIKHGWLQKLGL